MRRDAILSRVGIVFEAQLLPAPHVIPNLEPFRGEGPHSR